MIPILSVVTSVKDYLEVVHKLIEYDASSMNINYSELGAIITYFVISLKNALVDFFSFSWLKSLWSLPVIIPDISSAMISEISVLDGYFHNAFNFLDTPVAYGQGQNAVLSGVEKFTIGVLNSLFLFLPTSTAHIITLRRFVMQGLEAGYISGLGTIAGNVLWLASVILGWRFFVIPWLSLDIFRYILGFVLLVKYMWDSYNERRTVLEDVSKQKIFLLNFLLALTEQTSIYPFISNMSFNPGASMFESFPAQNYPEFLVIHGAYLLGITVGCLSLLHLTCWFWENPAFKIYMWMISSFKVSTGLYYKVLNFTFLYLTMISAIASVPYYGLDYTITNPLGYVNDDRIIQDKLVLETSFLGGKASDRNTRRNPGRHGRRERWKRRIRKYRTFDASLYDQGIYDLFTIEDLNYGFDRFWLRRKLRNHHVKFRFFPGPWMRSFKKQLAKPRLESYTGPRVEFFRILFEQVYHPSFHAYESANSIKGKVKTNSEQLMSNFNKKDFSIYAFNGLNTLTPITFGNPFGTQGLDINNRVQSDRKYVVRKNLIHENSTLRKFVRKFDTRLKSSDLALALNSAQQGNQGNSESAKNVYSKRWKQVFSKLYKRDIFAQKMSFNSSEMNLKKQRKILTNEPILRYRALLQNQTNNKVASLGLASSSFSPVGTDGPKGPNSVNVDQSQAVGQSLNKKQFVFLHPLKFYLQQEAAFNRKLRYYTPSVYRKFSVENNAPYFRVMMRRYFYNFKPSNRWERTMKVASLRKARRKTTRIPRKLQNVDQIRLNTLTQTTVDSRSLTTQSSETGMLNNNSVLSPSVAVTSQTSGEFNRLQKPTYNYSVVSKRASRYRYQIYKDVLQHWYYSPFNRLLLKMDVDSFIRRQPNSHFLTTKEENLLHLRRVLLSEHYNTLRWYTNMEHYRSMKTRLGGGTKSFSSRVYNQQFAGTFKKIRHLFAITPSQGNVVLKFDQPLYNEYPNTSVNPLLNSMVIHEELLNDDLNVSLTNAPTALGSTMNLSAPTQDLVSQSQQVVREYLMKARSAREEYIKTLLNENNYTTLTQFIYKGQKTRGDEPTTNQRLLNNQEKNYLLSSTELSQIEAQFNTSKLRSFINDNNLMEDLYVTYLKKWKRRINDQEALKNYLTRRIDKREKRKQKKEKHLLSKLKQLETLYSSNTPIDKTNSSTSIVQPASALSDNLLTTGFQKSIFEGLLTLKNVDTKVATANEKSFYKKTDRLLLASKTLDPSTKVTTLKSYKRFDSLNAIKKQQLVNDIQVTTTQLKMILDKYKTTGVLTSFKEASIRKQIQNSITNRISFIYKTFTTTIPSALGLTKITRLVKPVKRKTLAYWRKKERSLGKQKRLRKEFKVFKDSQYKLATSNKTLLDSLNDNSFGTTSEARKKRDSLVNENDTFNQIYTSQLNENANLNTFTFIQKFKRKRSAQRHSRSRRNRGVFKKRSLSNSLKKEFKTLNNSLSYESKVMLYNKINPTGDAQKVGKDEVLDFELKDIKQRKAKQRKQRYWKQKRSKFSQRRQKYRKRRRYSIGKIRLLSKQLKRVKNKIEIQNWWWKQFLPSIQASTDALWQIEKDKLIQQKLSELSTTDLSARDRLTNSFDALQIGNKDFKPLALPESIRLMNQLKEKNFNINSESLATLKQNSNNEVVIPQADPQNLMGDSQTNSGFEVVNQLYENLFTNNSNNNMTNFSKFLVPNTSLPFYAGWDESLRKFVVTNRMLSRQDAGYQMKQVDSSVAALKPLFDSYENDLNTTKDVVFTQAPLEGMNAATTLYWQIPFTTYDPDQFFALGMDGFSPIGWRKFLFRHSILKSWLTSKVQESTDGTSSSLITTNKKASLIVQKQAISPTQNSEISPLVSSFRNQIGGFNKNKSIFNQTAFGPNSESLQNSFDSKNTSRRLKKRYRRVKKHPRTPVWFPSGPLLNQVLPVHYIYVFYKRSRLPRDRYLKRRLLNAKMIQSTDNTLSQYYRNGIYANTDFTLRKRLKPKRKYHLKRNFYSSNVVIPRRFKFIGSSDEPLRWRPLSSTKINKSVAELIKEQKLMRTKQRNLASKQQTPMLRVKQLKRRVQRQIIRSVWRYRPRAGGFVWPGDYLKLELVKAPKLKASSKEDATAVLAASEMSTTTKRKTKRKKKRTLVEWQIQPKKYLYEKHNIKVLKKKLEKAHRSDKIRQKVKELHLTKDL